MNEIKIVNPLLTEEDKRSATVNFADSLIKIVFFFLMDEQEGMLVEVGDNLEEVNQDTAEEFSEYLWEVAASFISMLNIDILGKDTDGKFVCRFSMPESVKDFLIKEDIGKNASWFYEDILNDSPESSAFGIHEDKMEKIFNNYK